MVPRLAAAAALLLAAGCGWGAGTGTPPGPPVLTLAEYLGMGETRANAFLSSGADPECARLAAAVRAARASVVRIRVHYARSGGSYQTDHGTGFLLRDGVHVVTAGHVLDAFRSDPSAEAVLVAGDGTVLHARPVAREFSGKAGIGADFGVLELAPGSVAPPGAGLEAGPAAPGRLVAILGFPGRLGIDASGAVAGDDHEKNGPLSPLTLLGRIRPGADLTVEPVAGCVPEGGMSGGPVLDSGGRVVGIEASVSRSQEGSSLSYTVNAFRLWGAALPGLEGK